MSHFYDQLRLFLRDARGNFAVFAVALVPLSFAAGSLVLDFANVMMVKARTQNAADAAALAVAARLADGTLTTASEAESEAVDYFNGEISNELAHFSSFAATPSASVSQTLANGLPVWQVAVDVEASIDLTPLAVLFDASTMTFNVLAETQSASQVQHAFSMALVLDVSGSMDWYGDSSTTPSNGQPKKIEALKTAVTNLLTQIDEADPTADYSRVGAIAYNSDVVDYTLIDWGTDGVQSFTDRLTASGGTSSWYSFFLAYAALGDAIEDSSHLNKNGLTPDRIMIFMTDGNNNALRSDFYTQNYCDLAKADGITIYTVAFMAPDKGKALLSYCATDSEHYFEPSSADDLVDAFSSIGQTSSEMLARLTK
ncbi:vWA domain-containing protein [Pseudohoeflea coraliihabitans]|uniref:VWA domain-containing protein n=1 Tax=Pseudohoeflea coraliihabitans TaxID=2860393 RepID=A0ABS6WSL1_9HYPH|nr:vWA domain-containing protein [Pseudohoeflea sp. DP4N28-3]MBW3098628.1 VWA domain-containing protein [Pseudohoeflea sp. DP4N28-3]